MERNHLLLINALAGQVGTGTRMSGDATNQELSASAENNVEGTSRVDSLQREAMRFQKSASESSPMNLPLESNLPMGGMPSPVFLRASSKTP
jgi:hypothetical protein